MVEQQLTGDSGQLTAEESVQKQGHTFRLPPGLIGKDRMTLQQQNQLGAQMGRDRRHRSLAGLPWTEVVQEQAAANACLEKELTLADEVNERLQLQVNLLTHDLEHARARCAELEKLKAVGNATAKDWRGRFRRAARVVTMMGRKDNHWHDVAVAEQAALTACVAERDFARAQIEDLKATLQTTTADMNRYFGDWQNAVGQVQDLQAQQENLVKDVGCLNDWRNRAIRELGVVGLTIVGNPWQGERLRLVARDKGATVKGSKSDVRGFMHKDEVVALFKDAIQSVRKKQEGLGWDDTLHAAVFDVVEKVCRQCELYWGRLQEEVESLATLAAEKENAGPVPAPGQAGSLSRPGEPAAHVSGLKERAIQLRLGWDIYTSFLLEVDGTLQICVCDGSERRTHHHPASHVPILQALFGEPVDTIHTLRGRVAQVSKSLDEEKAGRLRAETLIDELEGRLASERKAAELALERQKVRLESEALATRDNFLAQLTGVQSMLTEAERRARHGELMASALRFDLSDEEFARVSLECWALMKPGSIHHEEHEGGEKDEGEEISTTDGTDSTDGAVVEGSAA